MRVWQIKKVTISNIDAKSDLQKLIINVPKAI